MPKYRVPSSRRGFLISMGAGSVAAVAAAVTAATPETKSSEQANGQQAKRGYRVSEHINKYYRTTRV